MPHLREDVVNLTRQLITNITNIEEGSQAFQRVEQRTLKQLESMDSMVFVRKSDLDEAMSSIVDKFIFHGFCQQAEELRVFYDRFVPPTLSKEDTNRRLAVVKFLLCMSESPTRICWHFSERLQPIATEDVIDWPTYLKEGIERWSPPPIDDASEVWSDDNTESSDSATEESTTESDQEEEEESLIINGDEVIVRDPVHEYFNTRQILCSSIQNTWFNEIHNYMLPESTNVDANIAVYWDGFLRHCTKGLVSLQRSNIITEYKAMREILWQFWEPHSSSVFHFIGNNLVPRCDTTISSVRPTAFSGFTRWFLLYINFLQSFRDFCAMLSAPQAAETFKSYASAVGNIIKPMYRKLIELEAKVAGQDEHMTLLTLAKSVRATFKNAEVLKRMHANAVLDLNQNSAAHCASNLLAKLHEGLLHCVSKDEQDVYLSVYLESLYKYFAVIDTWLTERVLADPTEEFVVVENQLDPLSVSFTCRREFSVSCKTDSVLRIISDEVLHIGRNTHLLGLLGKLHLLRDNENLTTLHEELIRRFVRKTADYFGIEAIDDEREQRDADEADGVLFKFPAICPDSCKYPTEMDRLDNLVDTDDGFLMNAFASYFTMQKEVDSQQKIERSSLFETLSKLTKNVFPAKQIIHEVIVEILRERYFESGYLVKRVFVHDYQLEKHLRLLQHVYLFKDDVIYLLYRRIFRQMQSKRWHNEIWLTTQLQDLLMDMYPDFYDKCSVRLKFTGDPLPVVEYQLKWPLTIIISDAHLKQYKEIFQLILQIKWGLYMLNHLYFNEIETSQRHITKQLKILRFCLSNEFSSIQHYILGYVYGKCVSKFHIDFDRACNLDTLVASHDEFVTSLHSTVTAFRKADGGNYGFDLLLQLVKKLSWQWTNSHAVVCEDLEKCMASYRKCHDRLNPILHPRDILFDCNF